MGAIMAMRTPVARSQFFGAAPLSRGAAVARPVVASRQGSVKAQAFFGFGGSKKEAATGAAPQYYICVDCGYIYDGDFKKAPGSYKCPVCNSPKSRFKVYKGAVKGKPNNTGAAMKQRFQARQW